MIPLPNRLLIPLALAVSIVAGSGYAQTRRETGVLKGQITDPSGGAIAGASVSTTGATGTSWTVLTDQQGRYRFDAMETGTYSAHASATGFADFDGATITLPARDEQTLDIRLQIRRPGDKLTVISNATGVDPDPTRNAGQIVIAGDDLDALSDDPDDLAKDLAALAGPSAGSEAPDFYIDGFAGARLPRKASIREIRVNQNPFSSEFDRVGFGAWKFSPNQAPIVSMARRPSILRIARSPRAILTFRAPRRRNTNRSSLRAMSAGR